MLFNSYELIFLFLPVSLLVFFLLARHDHRLAATWWALASLGFYAYWNLAFVVLLVASVAFNYVLGRLIGQPLRKKAKMLLTLAISINLALLAYFKYANFFLDSVNQAFETNLPLVQIILPLGISFFTFTQIAFLVDTYRGTAHGQIENLRKMGSQPKLIVLSLDFLNFLEVPATTRSISSHASKTDHAPPLMIGQQVWRFDPLFSLASIPDRQSTLRIQHDAEAETITTRGFHPLKEYLSIARSEGYYKMFRQRAEENVRIYLKKAKGSLALDGFTHLRAIFDMAAKSGSNMKLIISPYHTQIFALFEATFLSPAVEEWKGLVTCEISSTRQRHPAAHLALYDLSGYGIYNCERIPAKGDHKTASRSCWDAGHFKKKFGDIVLTQMFAPSGVSAPPIVGKIGVRQIFGFQLDESTRILNR